MIERKSIFTTAVRWAGIALGVIWPGVGASAAQERAPDQLAALAQPSSARIAAEAIDIDALTLESDFTIFMEPSCSEEVRIKALRRLWRLLPPADSPSI